MLKSSRAHLVLIAAAMMVTGCNAPSSQPSLVYPAPSPQPQTPKQTPNSPSRDSAIPHRETRPATETTERLDQIADITDISPETPFSDALDILRHTTTPPLNIAVLWNDLELNAGIDRATPVGFQGVSGVKLRTNLELMLASLSAGLVDLDYIVRDGIVIIATRDSLPRDVRPYVYDITDLSQRPADYYSQTGQTGTSGGVGRNP
jgi:hypothetical protein